MHIPTLFYTLATLTITAAVPVTAGSSMTVPSPTQAMIAPSQVSPVGIPSMTPVGAYQCPQKQLKKCCMSLQETSRMLVDGIGELVPALGGIAVSSKVSFNCVAMADDVSPNSCDAEGYAPMCCDSDKGAGINACKPFEEVKEKYYKSLGYNKGDQSQAEFIEDVLS
ncbi:hypothetical protein F1880_007019 [Penicillium rolfsii]|nr:hypothetical protein F1880_007019 [Penicillium rolfsii]